MQTSWRHFSCPHVHHHVKNYLQIVDGRAETERKKRREEMAVDFILWNLMPLQICCCISDERLVRSSKSLAIKCEHSFCTLFNLSKLKQVRKNEEEERGLSEVNPPWDLTWSSSPSHSTTTTTRTSSRISSFALLHLFSIPAQFFLLSDSFLSSFLKT